MTRLLIFFLLWTASPSLAHEVRPAYLELIEKHPGEFAVLWKTPMRGNVRLSLLPEFSGNTEVNGSVSTRQINNAAVQTWRLNAQESLRGQTVRIAGLEGTMTDALVRVTFNDDTMWTQRLTPGQPAAVIPLHPSGLAGAGVYFSLGVEHILLGIDHLLFVLALLFMTKGIWQVVKTVTAFTLAHSITLALATLGVVRMPPPPIEAAIALSIVFVAAEIIHSHRGRESITARAPWIVAFSFGLLHGFGFAGALSEIGLPDIHISLALMFFNLGVEAGQLMFIAAALSLIAFSRRLRLSFPRWAELIPAYGIGSIAMFWVLQRVTAF